MTDFDGNPNGQIPTPNKIPNSKSQSYSATPRTKGAGIIGWNFGFGGLLGIGRWDLGFPARPLPRILAPLFLLIGLAPLHASPDDDAKRYPTVSGIDFSKFPKPPGPPTGRALHVAPGGRGGDGSAGRPFDSILPALRKAAAGDVLLLHAGRYPLPEPAVIETDGLRIAAAGDGPVTVVPEGGNGEAFVIHGDRVVLEGFTVEGFKGSVITFGRTDRTQKDVVISKLVVKGGTDAFRSVVSDGNSKRPLLSGLLLSDVRIEGATLVGFNIGEGPVTDVRLEKVTVAMPRGDSGNSGADAVAVERGDNILIRGCDIAGASADGIDLKATRVAVYDTVIHDVGRNGVKFWHGGDLVNSLVHHTGADAAIVLDGGGTYRILHTIVAFHAPGGEAYTLTCAYDHPDEKSDLTIANSIFYKNAGPVWVSRGTTLRVTRSLFTGARGGTELVLQKKGDAELSVEDDGGWKALEKAGIAEGNLPMTAAPLFADEAKGDYRLKPGSPGIDAGAPAKEAYPPSDRLGAKRVQGRAPDLGPVEGAAR